MTLLHDMTQQYIKLYRSADAATKRQGARWYLNAAFDVIGAIPARVSLQEREVAAAVAAHLSPRIAWADCVTASRAVLFGEPKPRNVMSGPWKRAQAALVSPTPLETFGPRAIKTEPFARALAGDETACVVDIHMVSAGLGARYTHAGFSTADFRRLTLDGIEALKAAADAAGEPVAHVQATIWLHWLGTRPDFTKSYSF